MCPSSALIALPSDVQMPGPAGGGGLYLCRWQALESRSHESGLMCQLCAVNLADSTRRAPTRTLYPTYSVHSSTFSLSRAASAFCETFSADIHKPLLCFSKQLLLSIGSRRQVCIGFKFRHPKLQFLRSVQAYKRSSSQDLAVQPYDRLTRGPLCIIAQARVSTSLLRHKPMPLPLDDL